MIDFSTLQTTPVPPAITELKMENQKLSKRNKYLRTTVIVLSSALISFIVYHNIRITIICKAIPAKKIDANT